MPLQEGLCILAGGDLPESVYGPVHWGARVCPGVCLGAGVMNICWGMSPVGEGVHPSKHCWDLYLNVCLGWCLHSQSCPGVVWVSVWQFWAHSPHSALFLALRDSNW